MVEHAVQGEVGVGRGSRFNFTVQRAAVGAARSAVCVALGSKCLFWFKYAAFVLSPSPILYARSLPTYPLEPSVSAVKDDVH